MVLQQGNQESLRPRWSLSKKRKNTGEKYETSTALILRSAVLNRRFSGGRQHPDGHRSRGMPMATREAFERVAKAVTETIQEVGFKIGE